MKKNDIFTFITNNGVKVKAIVIDCLGVNFEEVYDAKQWDNKYLCYAQNRLFYYIEWTHIDKVVDDNFIPSCKETDDWYYAIKYHSHEVKTTGSSQEILVDYCVFPSYDTMLK